MSPDASGNQGLEIGRPKFGHHEAPDRQEGTQGSQSSPSSDSRDAMPSISLPKGGGAIRNIGEKFDVNAPTGTGSLTIPISVSRGRAGIQPDLKITYNSGNGNGPFGLGWDLSVPNISRKTDKGLPRYRDEGPDAETDVYLLGGEDLVPVFKFDSNGTVVVDDSGQPAFDDHIQDGFSIRTYRSRIENDLHRVQRWTHLEDPGKTHWRTVSTSNITSIYGLDDNSRIAHPEFGSRSVFRWLLAAAYDVHGNASIFIYKPEDSSNIPASAHELNRDPSTRSVNRYLKTIRYGNLTPNRDLETWTATSVFALPKENWNFSVVFDYGEHDTGQPTPAENTLWPCRLDPFSASRSGFEIRTYRLCKRVLMFHHFSELPLKDYLVRSLGFSYDENLFSTYLSRVTQTGYIYQPSEGQYASRDIPPLEFSYSRFPSDEELARAQAKDIDEDSLRNLPVGVYGKNYQWLDLDGSGLSGTFAEQGEGWYFKENLSTFDPEKNEFVARLGPAKLVTSKPRGTLSENEYQFLSLAANGQLDLVSTSRYGWGYFTRRSDGDWDDHKTFRSIPNVDVNNSQLKFIDVTGDGLADIIVTEDQCFTYYPSMGYDGFSSGENVSMASNEETGARLIFADLEQTIYLADMTGDGLTDILRIRNKAVCYWPNFGYGHFGPKVSMDNSPYFDTCDHFSQNKVRIADIDGSGTTDILYLGAEGVDIYLNQSGNGFSDCKRLTVFPQTENWSAVGVADIMGTGMNCLVWSSPLPGNVRRPMKYIDLTQGVKPNLLVKYVNNLGAETRVHYAPSTVFYQNDKLAGQPWHTQLPFPVHVVNKVETFDYVSRNYFAKRFAYHHGYFDGFEREFRGFAFVEEWDSELFGTTFSGLPETLKAEATNLDSTWTSPLNYTKSWFHTGAYIEMEKISQQLAHEYFGAPSKTDEADFAKFQESLLDDTVLPAGLSSQAAREACRALKAQTLRREVYADDGTPQAKFPYTVSENNYSILTLQGRLDGHLHSSFMVRPRETLTYQYERNMKDPRVTHDLNLEFDVYGNALKTVKVAYGRSTGALTQVQSSFILVYNEMDMTNSVIEAYDYLAPRQCDTRSYQLYGFEVPGDRSRFQFKDFTSGNISAVPAISYEAQPAGGRQKRLISHRRTLFRRNDLSGLLPAGRIESLGLHGEDYQLALTFGLINIVYQRKVESGSSEFLLPDPLRILGEKGGDQGGYVDLDGNGNWWIPSGRLSFASDPAATPQQELETARGQFFQERLFTDPFGQVTRFNYDAYDLLHTEVIDASNNVTRGENDYHALQPYLVTDPNGNRSQCSFDEIGRVVGRAAMGKLTENVGDNLDGFETLVSPEHVKQFFVDPKGPIASVLLGNATTRIIEDMSRFWLEPEPSKKLPAVVASISRESHLDSDGGSPKLQVLFSYYDGFGREIQRKIQAEPGPIVQDGGPVVSSRWVGSGWKIFNNKGLLVREYEPFFHDSHEFSFDHRVGVSSTTFYDALDRVVGTLHPDHSWSKIVFAPWQHVFFDENDTVLLEAKSDPDIGQHFRRLPETESEQSWYGVRIRGQNGTEEKSAAVKTEVHANTPKIVHLDSFSRPFLTVVDNGSSGRYQTTVELDIAGNLLRTTDALGRVADQTTYDMVGHPIHQAIMDAGERWTVFDASSKSIYKWDSRGHQFRYVHDCLRRDISLFLKISDHAETKIVSKVYGDTLQDGHVRNQRGKLFQVFDQGGVEAFVQYDFKGNLVATQRQFAMQYKAILDWSGTVPLDETVLSSSAQFDALNRVTNSTLPDNTIIRASYNDRNLLTRVVSNLAGERINDQPALTTFIQRVEYNAKGQRTLIIYGNNSSTKYMYDCLTFRLRQLQTWRQGTGLQNLSYVYDPVGNITSIRDDAQQTVYFRNTVIDPSNDYTYDATYRITQATGREHIGQRSSGGQALGPTPPTPCDAFHTGLDQPGNGNLLGRYTESYAYDPVGNILLMDHTGSDASVPGWTRSYSYGGESRIEVSKWSNRLTSTTIGSTSTAYTYDAHGNMTLPHLSQMDWDHNDQIRATSTQVVTNGGTPETTWYVYNHEGNRIRKVTERYAATGESPRKLKERLYLGAFEVFKKYAGNGVTLSYQRDSVHIMDEHVRVAIIDIRKTADEPLVPSKLVRYQLGNHLSSVSLELDDEAQIVSYEEYTPFGSTSYQAVRSTTQVSKRYAYTAKERDKESGLYYHGARYYACWLGRWCSVDPATQVADGFKSDKHSDSSTEGAEHDTGYCSSYVYVENRPTVAIDPDGCDAVYIVFPDYRAEVYTIEMGGAKYPVRVSSGHAGVLLIDNKTGTTKYYEFGRYDPPRNQGLVRKSLRPLPNVKIGPAGNATDESLAPILKQLSKDHGHGGPIEGAYIPSDKFKEMNNYALKKFAENKNPEREEYSVLSNNCATFASDIVRQDPAVARPIIINSSPKNIVGEYWDEGHQKIQYPPPAKPKSGAKEQPAPKEPQSRRKAGPEKQDKSPAKSGGNKKQLQ